MLCREIINPHPTYVPGLCYTGVALGGSRVTRTDMGLTMVWNSGFYIPGSMLTVVNSFKNQMKRL